MGIKKLNSYCENYENDTIDPSNTHDNYFDPYEDYDEYYDNEYDEWKKDTWYAMTDGEYGDMPEGFDGDYDFLGY